MRSSLSFFCKAGRESNPAWLLLFPLGLPLFTVSPFHPPLYAPVGSYDFGLLASTYSATAHYQLPYSIIVTYKALSFLPTFCQFHLISNNPRFWPYVLSDMSISNATSCRGHKYLRYHITISKSDKTDKFINIPKRGLYIVYLIFFHSTWAVLCCAVFISYTLNLNPYYKILKDDLTYLSISFVGGLFWILYKAHLLVPIFFMAALVIG